MLLSSKAIVYGDDINTDLIIAGKYTKTLNTGELAAHAMEDLDPDFHKKSSGGAFLVAGEYFGCGSSREQAPVALIESGVLCVVAKSFSRIFYRNAINIGLPILECPQAAVEIEEGDEVQVNLSSGIISDVTTGRSYQAQPLPDFVLKIADAGGMVAFLQEHDIEELMATADGAA